MKAVCIVGMTNGLLIKSGGIINAIGGTLSELGLPVTQIKLIDCYLPYYEEGAVNEGFAKIAQAIRDVKNIIFAYNATDGSPSAVMKVFLEYISAKENRSIMDGKNLLNISISEADGEKEAAEYISGIIERLGGYELTRICIGGEAFSGLLGGSFPMSAVEKYAEDYYRLIKQNRLFIRSGSYRQSYAPQTASDGIMNLKNQVESSMRNTRQSSIKEQAFDPAHTDAAKNARPSVPEAYSSPGKERDLKKTPLSLDDFNSRQQDDIEELTRIFAGKIKSERQPQQSTPIKPGNSMPAEEQKRPLRRDMYSNDVYSPGLYPKNPHNDTGRAELAQPPLNGASNNNFIDYGTGDFGQAAYYQSEPSQNGAARYQRIVPPAQSAPPPYGEQETGFPGAIRRAQNEARPPVVPREKTCRQMTQSLPHYFQSQLAQDTEAVFQFNISGDESFSGYIVIRNRENDYYDGQYDSPDITIISSATVWQDVLKGKLTAQKAFMTGQLKVRGNFMLLNRFDQLYKKM